MEKIKYAGGEAIVVNWKNWKTYDDRIKIDKHAIWHYKQNYPEAIVEDILTFIRNNDVNKLSDAEIRDKLYEILLKRGVNKWLFVRKLLIRYKKLIAKMITELSEEYKKAKKEKRFIDALLLKTELNILNRIRGDLKTLCMTPRYVIWNYKEPAFIWDLKIKKRWLDLYCKLNEIKFNK